MIKTLELLFTIFLILHFWSCDTSNNYYCQKATSIKVEKRQYEIVNYYCSNLKISIIDINQRIFKKGIRVLDNSSKKELEFNYLREVESSIVPSRYFITINKNLTKELLIIYNNQCFRLPVYSKFNQYNLFYNPKNQVDMLFQCYAQIDSLVGYE